MSREPDLADKVMGEVRSIDAFLEDLGPHPRRPGRIDADPENIEKGLAQLVLTVVELLRELMERQAVRRMEAGSLDEDEVERLGQAFMALGERMDELKETFDLDEDDLQLDLGPFGRLL